MEGGAASLEVSADSLGCHRGSPGRGSKRVTVASSRYLPRSQCPTQWLVPARLGLRMPVSCTCDLARQYLHPNPALYFLSSFSL